MQIVHDYRTLHSIPELDRALPQTRHYIQKQLAGLGCQVFSPADGAICAFFNFCQPSSLAFRADMDGLPIREQTGLPWQSRHPGTMHACGHDGHTAILLELARRLRQKTALRHNILLIFQPAEETDGGAKDICQAGVLQTHRVQAIFGLHLWPGLPKGQLFSRPGILMSRSCGIYVRFNGISAHIARADRGRDALDACCRFYRGASALSNGSDCLLKFGKLDAGTAPNVICDKAELWGSLRTRSPGHRLKHTLNSLCASAAKETGCQGEISFSEGYPAVCNDPALWQLTRKKCPVFQINRTFWTADDFSFYQKTVPGLYFLLGTGNTPPLHSPDFAFNESILSTGADHFEKICETI